MKTRQDENNFWHTLRKRFRRHAKRHVPMLVLNIPNFNFTNGWRRTFFGYEYAHFNA
jgi:hypothetical protein